MVLMDSFERQNGTEMMSQRTEFCRTCNYTQAFCLAHLGWIYSQLLDDRQTLSSEGFIQLKDLHITDTPAGLLQLKGKHKQS